MRNASADVAGGTIPSGCSSQQRWTAAILFCLCAGLYFFTRTPALDEWDSVQFALGVGDFNLWRHHPHPPGYPGYIAAGWLFSHGLRLSVPAALYLSSALGGGLFVAGWYRLIARHWGSELGVLTAASLGGLLVTWMTATKVLTDGLAAGLLVWTLVVLDDVQTGPELIPERRRLLSGTFLAGLTASVRPQNIGILLLITVLATRRCRGLRWRWLWGLGGLLAGCLLWLLPTLWLQAHTPEAAGDWLAYPHQLLAQWRWRLDQPKAFLGATGQSTHLLVYRLQHHLLGWLTRGAGFALDAVSGWLEIGVVTLGATFYALRQAPSHRPERSAAETPFWQRQLPWALAYGAMIFICLPGDQRYYLPIFPLLLLPVIVGWRWALGRAHRLVWLLPLLLFGITLPYAIKNHVEPAPPALLVRWLQHAWRPADRTGVWLILAESRRHAEYYAPDFHIIPAETFPATNTGGNANVAFRAAWAVYTDDPVLASTPRAGGRWLLIQSFGRSPLIYRKHNEADLYVFRPQALVE